MNSHGYARIDFIFFILFLTLSLSGFCSSPRLIIVLGPQAVTYASQLQKDTNGHLLFGKSAKVKRKIVALDQSDPNHIMIAQTQIKNLETFAHRIGYAVLHLDDSYERAKMVVENTIDTMPLTDKDLPRTDPNTVGLFYDLLMKVDQLFEEHHLTYWLTCGSLLGAVRHQGIIPWDDDIDIAIFEKDLNKLLKLKPFLREYGLELSYHPKLDFYKIYFKNGKSIIADDGNVFDWTYPFIDIFLLVNVDGKFTYSGKIWQFEFKKKDYYTSKDLHLPLPKMAFGPLTVPVPHHSHDYLNRMYGKDWPEVAFVSYSHKEEKWITKIKVDLCDHSPPAYILPNGE